MKEYVILFDSYLTDHIGSLPEDGNSVYELLVSHFSKGEKVLLDFSGVELLTTACLNKAIGLLYKDFTTEQLRCFLSFTNLDEVTARRIKKVTTFAKVFYSNQDQITKNVEEVLDGKA